MMALTNVGASIYLTIGASLRCCDNTSDNSVLAVVLMGQIAPVVDFAIRFPSVLYDIILFSLARYGEWVLLSSAD